MLEKLKATALMALLTSNPLCVQAATPPSPAAQPGRVQSQTSAASPEHAQSQSRLPGPPAAPETAQTQGSGPCTGATVFHQLNNGIDVEQTRVLDDATLEQQLELNATRLAILSGLDQASLISHLGNVSGMNQSFSSFALNVQGGPSAQTTSVAAIPNTQTVQTNLSNTGTTASNGAAVPTSTNQQQTQTTTNPATNQTTTVNPSVAVPTATPATIAPAVTTGFSAQSSAVLSEQMQLAAGLETQLLEQEGALSDRMMIFSDSGGVHKVMRPRATIGFDITPAPDKAEQDAAAVVELIVTNCAQLSQEPPAATAILPSEKTFNVAAVRNSSTSLGGGIATQFLGASATWAFGHNSYFLVQDQDTVAQIFQPEESPYCNPNNKCVGVRWIYRPVLGQRFVSPQRRTVAAQIAFSTPGSVPEFGVATVRTYWRHFDRKKGLLGPKLNKAGESISAYPILNYKLSDIKPVINAQSIDDLGNGQVVVRLDGSFPMGTYVAIGNNSLVDQASGLIRETSALRFVANVSDLLIKPSYLVSKSGDRVPLVIDQPTLRWLANDSVRLSTLDPTYSRLVVNYCESLDTNAPKDGSVPNPDPLLLLVAGKAYGLSDAPLDREPQDGAKSNACDIASPDTKIPPGRAVMKSVGLTVPTATLLSAPFIVMKPLFAAATDSYRLDLIQQHKLFPLSQSDHLVLLQQGKTGADFLLLGNRLSTIKDVNPKVDLKVVGGGSQDADTADSIRYLSLATDQVQQFKFLVFTRDHEAPEAVAIPAVTLPTTSQQSIAGTVLKDDDSAVVTGTGLSALNKVTFHDAVIPFTVAKDGKSAVLTHLRSKGVTSTATVQMLKFFFNATPVEVKLDVFTEKALTVPR